MQDKGKYQNSYQFLFVQDTRSRNWTTLYMTQDTANLQLTASDALWKNTFNLTDTNKVYTFDSLQAIPAGRHPALAELTFTLGNNDDATFGQVETANSTYTVKRVAGFDMSWLDQYTIHIHLSGVTDSSVKLQTNTGETSRTRNTSTNLGSPGDTVVTQNTGSASQTAHLFPSFATVALSSDDFTRDVTHKLESEVVTLITVSPTNQHRSSSTNNPLNYYVLMTGFELAVEVTGPLPATFEGGSDDAVRLEVYIPGHSTADQPNSGYSTGSGANTIFLGSTTGPNLVQDLTVEGYSGTTVLSRTTPVTNTLHFANNTFCAILVCSLQ